MNYSERTGMKDGNEYWKYLVRYAPPPLNCYYWHNNFPVATSVIFI